MPIFKFSAFSKLTISWYLPLLALVALVLAACGDPTPTAVPPPTATATPAVLDPKAVAKQATDKLKALKSLHFSIDIKAGDVKIIDGVSFKFAEGDFSAPDKFRSKLRVIIPLGQVDAEVVGINTNQWLLLKNLGSWNKLPEGVGFRADVLFDPDKGLGAVVSKVRDLKFVGTDGLEKLDGTDVYHVKGIVSGPDIAPITSQTLGKNEVDFDAWIGKSDFLPRQVTFKEITTTPTASDWLLKFSDFDKPVEIKAPV